MRTLIADFRFAFRLLAGSPGFALVAALTLAIGIASTATVFTWIDSLLLEPFHGASHAEELAVLEMQVASAPNGGTSVSWLDYKDYREHLKSISGLALQRYAAFSLGDTPDDARLVWGELVSPEYFQTTGIRPVAGRMFSASANAESPGATPVVVISERLWRADFHGDGSIVGKTVRLNRRQMTVVGIAPAIFPGTAPALTMDLWVPAPMAAELGLMSSAFLTDRNNRDFNSIVARLKPGITLDQARAEVNALAVNLSLAYPKTNKGVLATLSPPWKSKTGLGELLLAPLGSLMGVAVLLLLVVCANVSNLLLARSVARHREFGIRIALGASRWRVVRQLMAETLLLAIGAAVGAFILLLWMQGSLISLAPSVGLPLTQGLPLNWRITAFTLAVCLAAALATGMAPAWVSFRPDLNEVLKEGGKRTTSGTGARRARGLLVVAEVALATVALIGAGLFVRSFRNARTIPAGFDAEHVLFGRFFVESTGYSNDQIGQLMVRLRQELLNEPGVTAVSYSEVAPLGTTAGPYDRVHVDGYVPSSTESMNVNDAVVAPGYFATLRIPILAGREFTDADTGRGAPVTIVNQTFARRYFHGQEAVGRTVELFGQKFRVVGLAKDSKYFTPAESPRPFLYLAIRQFYYRSHELCLFVRTRGEPAKAVGMLRRVVARVDPNAAAFHAVPLAEYTQVSLFPQTVAATLMSALGLMCLLLAAIGIYSVMAYAVSQRTQEIGIRMAMGASSFDVIGMVVRQGMELAAAGLAVGMAGALAATRIVGSMLIQVDAKDPATFAAAALFLLAVSFTAAWLPALRATRIDPVAALRRE